MKQPIHRIKAYGVECSIWENQIQSPQSTSGTVTVLKATVERRYKNAQGEWAGTRSFGKNDLPLAILCLQRAYAEIIDRDNERSARERESNRHSDSRGGR